MGRLFRGTIIFYILALLILASPVPAHASTVSEFTIGSNIYRVDGVPAIMDTAPFVKAGRTYIPVRYAAYSLGIPESGISYSGKGVVTLIKGTNSVVVVIGDPVIMINGSPLRMDAVPVAAKGRTFLPVRYIAEAFGCEVNWNKTSRTVLLSLTDQTSTIETGNQVTFKWTYRGSNCSIGPLPLSEEVKSYYALKKHPQLKMDMLTGQNNFRSYADTYTLEPDYHGIVGSLAESLKSTAERGGYDILSFIASFSQGLDYIPETSSTDDYAKYPMETLYDKGGDCEDTAILTAVMLRHLGYGCALLIFPGTAENPGHIAVGIADDGSLSGSYYELDGKRYYYLEITATGWKIGDVPEKYRDQETYVVPVK